MGVVNTIMYEFPRLTPHSTEAFMSLMTGDAQAIVEIPGYISTTVVECNYCSLI
jgi:hypothetical protein